jgi:hypothetical protein
MRTFTHERRKWRNIAVALDQCRSWTDAIDELPV